MYSTQETTIQPDPYELQILRDVPSFFGSNIPKYVGFQASTGEITRLEDSGSTSLS